ncbi:hypothetical protein BDR04DRAFT_39687 [Suillus decipiens]|nr:hypothetical protein BDR04DRAFT_39687 [Suillus decipiens]
MLPVHSPPFPSTLLSNPHNIWNHCTLALHFPHYCSNTLHSTMHHHLAQIPGCNPFSRRSTHMPSFQFPTLHNSAPLRPYIKQPIQVIKFTQKSKIPLVTVMVIVYGSRPLYLVHGHFTALNIAPMQ